MKKTVAYVVGILIVVLILGVLAGWIFWRTDRIKPPVGNFEIGGSVTTAPLAEPTEKTWIDPAGFQFVYDSELTLNNHPEDQVNYANLVLIGKAKGSISILASDTKLKKLELGVKSVKTTLGGKEAVRTTLNTGVDEISIIDDAILFKIYLDPASELSYWAPKMDKIVASFEFVYPTPSASTSKPVSGGGQSSGSGVSGSDDESSEEVLE